MSRLRQQSFIGGWNNDTDFSHDECNALVDMLTFPNAGDFTSMVANEGM